MYIYSSLHLGSVAVASKVLEHLSASCTLERVKICPFDAVARRRWIRRGDNVPRNGLVVSSSLWSPNLPVTPLQRLKGSITLQSSIRPRTFLYAGFVKSLPLPEIWDRFLLEMFPCAEDQAPVLTQ